MNTTTKIQSIMAREILSTGSSPTVEAEVTLENGVTAVASTPRGSSEGSHEPCFLLDDDPSRFHGSGVLKAVGLVEGTIADALRGVDSMEQAKIDSILRELDGTGDLRNLGVNSVLAVSLACARAASISAGLPLYRYLLPLFGESEVQSLPRPMVVVIEGGRHADNSTDFQEYMILGMNDSRSVGVRNCAETYQELKKVLKENGYETNVGFEGAFAFSRATSNEEPLSLIEQAGARCGLEMGVDLGLAMDPAASEFYEDGAYVLAKEGRTLTASEMVALYSQLKERHPAILSIEDGLSEDDWEGWPLLKSAIGAETLVVGDDLTVTTVDRVARATSSGSINALLVKPNQAGTLSDAVAAIKVARAGGCEIVVSHRGGGETNDTFIVDLAVASSAGYIKCGITRGERVEKYNYLMKIEQDLS